MWDIATIKTQGRLAFKANYWPCVIVSLLLVVLVGSGIRVGSTQVRNNTEPAPAETELTQQDIDELTTTLNALSEHDRAMIAIGSFVVMAVIVIVGFLLKVFLFNPLLVGCYRFFRRNINDPTVGVAAVGEGFGSYGHVWLTLALRDVLLFLWTLLLIVPGIIKSYSYQLVPYIVKDNPSLSPLEAIKLSSSLMQGSKGRAFLLDLSFLGWALLGALTFGIVDVFWTTPYYESTKAALYLELLRENGRR